ncbi:MAG: HPr family phosphocarrier protein [Alphaproteobacteria bacterium]|nr:HPr family phosphocarrier protein [Alphaproteobacteria bacterium]
MNAPPLSKTSPVTGSALLTNAVGLHARPSVKLTQLAKTFSSVISVATDAAGPWIDAKSPVKIMRVKASKGTTIYFEASGDDATLAIAALIDLVERRFDESDGDDHG